MVSWLTGLAGSLLGRILAGGGSGDVTQQIQDVTARFQALFIAFVQFMQDLFRSQHQAWQDAHPNIVDGANGFERSAYTEGNNWPWLLQTILPQSLRWLDGHTHQWVDRKYDWQISAFWRYFTDLFKWREAIRDWRNNWVDPNIKDWRNWHAWFTTYPRAVIEQWHAWLQHPAWFAEWAAPPLWTAMLNYIHPPKHKRLRDELARTVIVSSPDELRPLHDALMAILLSNVPS